jgi:hypothetical protein
VDLDNGVGAVVLAREHLLGLGSVDLGFEFGEAALEVGGHVFAALGPFEEHAQVGGAARERVTQFDVFAQTASALQSLLRLGLVFPEIGFGDAGFEDGEFVGARGPVKDNSAGCWPA